MHFYERFKPFFVEIFESNYPCFKADYDVVGVSRGARVDALRGGTAISIEEDFRACFFDWVLESLLTSFREAFDEGALGF